MTGICVRAIDAVRCVRAIDVGICFVINLRDICTAWFASQEPCSIEV